jgi:hypothetical protein
MESLLRVRIKVPESSTKNGRYRLWLDKFMLIERIYPIEIGSYLQLEEIVHVKLSPGIHHIKIENLELETQAIINAVAINDTIYLNLSTLVQSFELR